MIVRLFLVSTFAALTAQDVLEDKDPVLPNIMKDEHLGNTLKPERPIIGNNEKRCGEAWITITTNNTIILNWSIKHCRTKELQPTQVAYLVPSKEDRTELNQVQVWKIQNVPYHRHPEFMFLRTGHVFWGDVPPNWANGSACLPFYVETSLGPTVLHRNCLPVHTTWMKDHFEALGNMPLSRMALPGTHNAGSYQFATTMSSPDKDRWVLCQDKSILHQLIYGIRYLDIRINYYPDLADKLWLNHNLVRVRPLLGILREVKTFLDATTHEVVIFDIHHVGFTSEEGHSALLIMLHKILGDHIMPFLYDFSANDGPTLKEFANKKRLIISYVDHVPKNIWQKWLWPRVEHLWAQSNNPDKMLKFLDERLKYPHSPYHSAMCQTTPTAVDIFLGRGSIRDSADLVSNQINSRLRSVWMNGLNIASPDFFLTTDVIESCIRINLERHKGFTSNPVSYEGD